MLINLLGELQMETKTFDGKNIKIRKVSARDLKHVKKFQDFVNSLVKEDAMILMNKRVSLKYEKKWLVELLKRIRKRKQVSLIAEYDNIIIAKASIMLDKWRKSHVGNLGISIRKQYRGIGLGKHLMREILRLAKKELKPNPKIIILSVYPINKPAVALYEKYGFKKVAEIPYVIKCQGKLTSEVIMILEL